MMHFCLSITCRFSSRLPRNIAEIQPQVYDILWKCFSLSCFDRDAGVIFVQYGRLCPVEEERLFQARYLGRLFASLLLYVITPQPWDE